MTDALRDTGGSWHPSLGTQAPSVLDGYVQNVLDAVTMSFGGLPAAVVNLILRLRLSDLGPFVARRIATEWGPEIAAGQRPLVSV